MLNKWLSIGRLTKDIEGKTYGKDNKQMAFGTIAVQRDFKTNGEYQADFFNFTLFGGTAKYALQYLKKGDLVSIEGSLQNNNYEKDGKTVYNTAIMVSKLSKLTGGSSDSNSSDDETPKENDSDLPKGVSEKETKAKNNDEFYETSKELASDEDLPF